MEQLFRDIFFRYPHVRTAEEPDGGQDIPSKIVDKPLNDLTDAEKEELERESKAFADELERCIFERYAELDKAGNPSPGNHYK